jgi:hypothetical protein
LYLVAWPYLAALSGAAALYAVVLQSRVLLSQNSAAINWPTAVTDWSIGVAAIAITIFVVSRQPPRDLRLLIVPVAAFIIVTGVGPWNVTSHFHRQSFASIERLLKQREVLIGGKLLPAETIAQRWQGSDKMDMSMAVTQLTMRNALSALELIFKGQSENPFAEPLEHIERIRAIHLRLGLDLRPGDPGYHP